MSSQPLWLRSKSGDDRDRGAVDNAFGDGDRDDDKGRFNLRMMRVPSAPSAIFEPLVDHVFISRISDVKLSVSQPVSRVARRLACNEKFNALCIEGCSATPTRSALCVTACSSQEPASSGGSNRGSLGLSPDGAE